MLKNSSQIVRVPESAPWRLSPRLSLVVNLAGVLLLVSAPFWLYELFAIYDEGITISRFASASTVALILAANYVMILHCTRRHPSLRRLMAIGLLAKLAAAGLYAPWWCVCITTVPIHLAHYLYRSGHGEQLLSNGGSDGPSSHIRN